MEPLAPACGLARQLFEPRAMLVPIGGFFLFSFVFIILQVRSTCAAALPRLASRARTVTCETCCWLLVVLSPV